MDAPKRDSPPSPAPPGADRHADAQVDYLEGLLEGFVAYDAGWVMTYMNAAAEGLLGRKRADVLGKTWHQAFPHAVGNPVDHMYQRVMRSRTPERMEYHYAHYGRWLEISASPVRTGGVAVYFRDISDRETLNRIGRALSSVLDLERLLQAVTDAGTEVSGARFGAFFYNQTNDAGESYMLYTLSGVEREAFAQFPMPRNTAVFAPTFSGERIVRSADITREPQYGRSEPHRGMPSGHLPVRSYLAVPVVSRSGEVLGGLFFGHPDPGVFTERAERMVAGIASQAAIAIDNARLYRSLQDQARRKDEFLAVLAHELRNPLAPIRTGLDLLRAAPLAPAVAQVRSIMERQVGQLTRLVDDLLEVSRISSGKIELRREVVDLAKAISAGLETSRGAIEAAHHKLEVILPREPLYVDADFVRLTQVLANLLNNAAKYTNAGGSISVEARREDAHALISVRDNGIGISAELLPRVFDMFAQADRARSGSGLGVGLTLVKRLVELHGGRVEARSEGLGKGATFSVWLPCRA